MNLISDFGFLDTLQKTLREKKFFKPTEIQSQAIPLLMSGQSVVGVSETGSGKTMTYALPLLHAMKSLELEGSPVSEDSRPRAVVMVPTRELGEQVAKVFKTFTHDTRLRVRTVLGGTTFEQARRNVAGPFEILLATPGRMVQLMDRNLLDLSDVRTLIFDEADQMLDQGFLPDSNMIVAACPADLQLALFSATVSNTVQELMNTLFAKAEVIRSSGAGKVVSTLKTQNRVVKDGKRWPLFEEILAKPVQGGTLVFTNTREQCDQLAQELKDKGFECVVYRGEMDKNERRANLKKFKSGQIDLLVATDLGARGLDIESVGRVINFHLPRQKENYLHRAGRTARAGRPGLVINLVTERDQRLMDQLGVKVQFPPRDLSAKSGKAGASAKTSKPGKSKPASPAQAKKPLPPRPAGSRRPEPAKHKKYGKRR